MRRQPAVRVTSLDRTVRGFEDMRHLDLLVGEESGKADESLLLTTWMREKERVLNVLTNIERAIICWRFGLDGDDELNLRQIGERCNLSKERIRQIQNAALHKLRLAFDGP